MTIGCFEQRTKKQYPPRAGWEIARGSLETLALVSTFVVSGLLWGRLHQAAPASATIYAREMPKTLSESASTDPTAPSLATTTGEIWLIDGFNVLHAAVLQGRRHAEWWKAEARAELLALAEGFEEKSVAIWIVFDGPKPATPTDQTEDRVRCVFAPSADDWLLASVRAAPDPSRLHVVTADRRLAERLRDRGARVIRPRDFVSRCLPMP